MVASQILNIVCLYLEDKSDAYLRIYRKKKNSFDQNAYNSDMQEVGQLARSSLYIYPALMKYIVKALSLFLFKRYIVRRT